MSEELRFVINVYGNAGQFFPAVEKAGKSATNQVSNFRSVLTSVGDSMFALNNIASAFDRVNASIDKVMQPGVNLNASLKDLQAITGVNSEKLKEIEQNARSAAKTFGGPAAQGVEAYKLLLSQLTPEIANVPSALDQMGKSVFTLSKTMGNDTTAAAEVLTTAMNQYQVALDNPMEASRKMAEMMNIMSAAAQVGSAELPQIKQALENSGMAAKMAGVQFDELNAAIQVLDKAGKKGAEGGIAIRNALSILSEGRFMPKATLEGLQAAGIDIEALGDKTKSFSERLQLLKPVLNDSALLSQIFGRENANAGIALITGTTLMDQYRQQIVGTNSATEQANIVMSSYNERMARFNARIDNIKISVFNFAQGVLPYFKASVLAVQGLTSTLTLINMIAAASEHGLFRAIRQRATEMYKSVTATWAMISSQGTWIGVSILTIAATKALTVAVQGLGRAIYSIPIVGWIALGITLLAGLFKMLWDKSEKFRQVLFSVWEVVKAVFHNIGIVIAGLWNVVKAYFTFIFDMWKFIINGIIGAAQWLWNGIVTVFQSIGNFINDYVIAPVYNGVMAAISFVAGMFSGVWGWITGTFSKLGSWLTKNLLEPVKGVFSKLWSFVGRILDKIVNALITPIKWIRDLWNKLFPKDKFADLGQAAAKGVAKGSESWAKSQAKAAGPAIAPVALPGQTAQAISTLDNKAPDASGSKELQSKTDGIAQGGARSNVTNITIGSLVENMVFSEGLRNAADGLEKTVREQLLRILHAAEVSA